MKKVGFRHLLCLFFLIFIASCQKVPDYTKVIPEDANVVMRIDVAQLADKSGLTGNQKLKDKLSELIEKDLTGESRKTAKAVVENPKESGIDFSEPLFLFSALESMDTDMAMLMKVSDRAKLTSLFDAMVAEGAFEQFKEDGEMAYSSIGSLFVAFNNEVIVLMKTRYNVSEAQYLSVIKSRMAASSDESIAGVEAFRKICKSDGDIQFLFDDNFVAMANEGLMNEVFSGLSFNIHESIKDIYNIGELSFDDGAIRLKAECIAKTPEAQKMLDKNLAMVGNIEGEFFSMIPMDTYMCAMFNINGDEILQNPLVKENMEKMTPDDKKILTDIFNLADGDVAVSISGNPLDVISKIPVISLYMEISDQKIVDELIASSGMPAQKDADGVYNGKLGRGADLYIKADKSRLAVSTVRDNVVADKVDKSADLSEFKGDKAMTYLNLKSVVELAIKLSGMTGVRMGLKEQAVFDLVQMFEDVKIHATADNVSKIDINLTDKNENSLKQFVDKAMSLADVSL